VTIRCRFPPLAVDAEGGHTVGDDESAGHAEEVELRALEALRGDADQLAFVFTGQDGQLQLPAARVDVGGVDDEDVVGTVRDHGAQRATIRRVGRRWVLLGFVIACLVVAVVVAWWPEDDAVVQVDSADQFGICVRNVDSGDQQCLAYTPEFPSEARYQVGECLRFRWVYRSDVPPHAKRITCPVPAA
jgi:hypothetical protein